MMPNFLNFRYAYLFIDADKYSRALFHLFSRLLSMYII